MRQASRIAEWMLGLIFRDRQSRELDEELGFHVDMAAAQLEREGVPPREARRRAAVALGGVERTKEQVRDAKGLRRITGMSLDMRLGARMLVRSWGLTVVAVIGLAVAIGLGAAFHAATAVMTRPVPLPGGEALVVLEVMDAEIGNQERRIVHDFLSWRADLRTVEDLTAYRTVPRNLITPDGLSLPAIIAEMTSSGFSAAATAAHLGRTLLPEDEHPGSPDVVVIGYDVWQSRFAGDPTVIGQEIRLGSTLRTVVGVMPEGFRFPVYHSVWVPLRLDAAPVPREGPGIRVFGRLVEGASLEQAQAELTTAGDRARMAYPTTHAQLRPRVVAYPAQLFDDMQGWEVPILHLVLGLLLTLVCVNVAILVYARTVTRSAEIAVRAALGASRGRIAGQLFMESLVLTAVAAAIGLILARAALIQFSARIGGAGSTFGGIPFWIDLRLTAGTVLYVAGLALFSAGVIGVVPALKAAGGHVASSLRELGGGTGLQLGRTWTLLIAAQVAIAVAFLPVAVSAGWTLLLHASASPGHAAEEVLSAQLQPERVPPEGMSVEQYLEKLRADATVAHPELLARLRAHPQVTGATLALNVPGKEPKVTAELEPTSGDVGVLVHARFSRVEPGLFNVLGVPILSGRGLTAADATVNGGVVISRSLAEKLAAEGAVLGRRIRYSGGYRAGGVEQVPDGTEAGAWYEVVGVVADFPTRVDPDDPDAAIYHALAPGESQWVALLVRVRDGDPMGMIPTVRQIAMAVDPTLQLHDVRTFGAVLREVQRSLRLGAVTLALVMLSVLLLCSAGIYALMSFTVARRRREIGIRTALGADPRRIIAGVFARALRQLAIGAAVGMTLAGLLDVATTGQLLTGNRAVLLPGVAAFMMMVGLLAAWGPARAALRVHPTDALRED